MGTIKKFEDLELWQIARVLSLRVFKMTIREPFSKDFRFRDQARASAGSVMDNIAEGFERTSRLEFINFLTISKGSIGEIRSQLYRAIDQEYIEKEEGLELIKEYEILAGKMSGFLVYLNASKIKGQKFKDRAT